MKIGIIGAGYVGLTTAICLASLKHEIILFDINKEKIKQIQEKKLPFYENGLQEILENVLFSGNLIPTDNLNELVKKTDGCFICVGTPTKNKSIDLSQIIDSVESLIKSLRENDKENYEIIIRSTVVPNTCKNKIMPIIENNASKLNLRLSMVQEFLREGNA